MDPKEREKDREAANSLLAAAPRIVNLGLERFAIDLDGQGVRVIQVQWSPRAGGNAYLAGLLGKLRS